MKLLFLNLFFAAGVVLSSCERKPADATAAGNTDPCSLLTADEVAGVQGAKITATTGSGSSAEGMLITQCVYTAADANQSVVITVTRTKPGAPKSKSALTYWEQTFSRFAKGEEAEEEAARRSKDRKESREREGEEEQGPPPERLTGLGDEAFWSPNPMGGSIYALKKSRDAFIRVNIGGPGEREKKMNHSKVLAQKALQRL